MKVKIEDDGLLIVPQTDFEIAFLEKNFSSKKCTAFLKSGLTPKETIGLKIKIQEV